MLYAESLNYKPVGELARALLNYKRPTCPHLGLTAVVAIICSFHLGWGYTKCFFPYRVLS